MKTGILPLVAVLALGAAATLTESGCAASGTRRSTGEYIDDKAITAKVKAELFRDPVVKALQVSVETFKGTVQLSGFVETPEQRARAEQIARNTPGVLNVQDEIAIRGVPAPAR